VQSEFGVACEFSSPYECSPANGGGDAYFEMIAKVESFDECHQLSTSMCETNSNCRVSQDDYCELDFSVAGDDVSAALENDGASAIAKNYFSLMADITSCNVLSESECLANSLCTYDSEYSYCHGDILPALEQVQTLCAVVDDAEIGSFSTLMSKFSGGSGSGVYSSSVGDSSSSSPPAPLTYCDLRDPSTGAHVPTANGEDGTCGELLTIGETCEPACHDGYKLDGPTTCVEVDGQYVPSRAVCSFAVEFKTTVTLYIDAQVVGHFVHGENNPVTGAVNHAQLAYGDANETPRLFVATLGENLNTVSFRGTMDELRVWALAVSRSDVAFWKEREIGVYHGSFKGLVAYYDFTHDPTKPTKVGALGYGVNGPVAKSSMTMTLNGAKWTRLEDGRTTAAAVHRAVAAVAAAAVAAALRAPPCLPVQVRRRWLRHRALSVRRQRVQTSRARGFPQRVYFVRGGYDRVLRLRQRVVLRTRAVLAHPHARD
jgi:hypothetical protein